VGVYSADDVTVEDSRLGSVHVEGVNDDPVLRFTLRRTTVASAEPKLAFFLAGGTNPAVCAEGQFVIENNLFASAQAGDADEPLAFTLRCSGGNTVRNNRIESLGRAAGIYLRDDANGTLFENNTVRVADSWAAALFWGSGTDINGEPSSNTFRRNVFFAAPARALWIQTFGSDNLFERNLFLSSSPEGARIAGGGNNTWDHNTFFNAAGVGITFDTLAMPPNVLRNSIVASQQGTPYGFDHAPDLSAYVGDHNLFWSGLGEVIFGSYGNLETWKLASSQDGHSIEADPTFVDRAAWDVRLAAGSAAIGADDTLAADIGALAFGCTN
jgi:parallel beta-helix repeat protein